MIYPPLWLWLLACALLFAGLWLSRSPRFLRLPAWLCASLSVASLVVMVYLLNAQYGGLVLRVVLP